MKLVLAVFLLGHASIHASYLVPAPPRTADGPAWPFDLTGSWLVSGLHLDPSLVRLIGMAAVLATVVAFGLAALSAIGWLPGAWWAGLVTTGSVASLVTLVLFFHPWLVLGIAIDIALLWAVLAGGWTPVGGVAT